LRRTLSIVVGIAALICAGSAASSASVNAPATHITSVGFQSELSRDPTFYVFFSFDGCPGWCLVQGTPVFTLHRGADPNGRRVALGTYLYRYQFTDQPDSTFGCTETSPCTVAGETQLKPNLRSLGCLRKPGFRMFTVVVSANVVELSATYPVSDFWTIRVRCRMP